MGMRTPIERGLPLVLLAALLCALAPALTQGEVRPAGNPFPDAHGYRLFDQDAAECGFNFFDIETSGTAILFTASGADPAEDDGGAVIALGAAFELYGESLTSLVVSSNGYLAGATTLVAEDGGDFSNDLMLPAIPDNAVGVPLRILPYHEELSGFTTGGTVYHQYFAVCPRPSEALGVEACTVVQWTDWALRGSANTFDLQALLYHDSFQLAFQIRPGTTALTGGTMGIQNRRASIALQYRPDQPLSTDTAICFFEPRYPSGGPVADLEISNADTVDIATPGQPVTYEIGLLNRGPSPMLGAEVDNPLPASLVGCSWTCLSSEGSACNTSGVGAIDERVDLAPGGWVDYLFTCDTAPVEGAVVHTVSTTLPAGATDPRPENNSATDINLIGSGSLPAALVLDHTGTQLDLTWAASCLTSDVDYAVYEGMLGSFNTHDPISCTTNNALTHSLPMPAGNAYYLVVPTNLFNEGSYGRTGSDQQRIPSANACYPHAVGVCP